MVLSAREIEEKDVDLIVNYWLTEDHEFLGSMGVDVTKRPTREVFTKFITEQIYLPYEEKKSYCITWEADKKPIGHSNINKIVFNEEAYMHLHIWNKDERKKGYGINLIEKTLPYFFENYKLKILYCEPYALNMAPNLTLQKAGFKYLKKYITIPGQVCFEQEVNLWKMSKEDFEEKEHVN